MTLDPTQRRLLEASGHIPQGASEVAPCRDGVPVTVAFGKAVVIHPHPSGVPGLPPLVLRGGDVLTLPEDVAQRLYEARVVLHPVTGNEKPADPPPKPYAPAGPRIHYGDAAPLDLTQGGYLSLRPGLEARQREREQLEREAREAEARHQEEERSVRHGDTERRLPVRVDHYGLPPGSWPSPPDVGW